MGGEPVGNFYLTDKHGADAFGDADQELVEMFALHAGIAIQNARLHQEVRKLAVVDERLRISRDLHDGIIQSIYAVSLSLEDVPELIAEDAAEAADRVDRAIDRLHTTIGDIRTFIVGLGPESGAGLRGALETMAHELVGGSAIGLTVDLSGAAALDRRLSPEAGHELVQIARGGSEQRRAPQRRTASDPRLARRGRDGDAPRRGRRFRLRSRAPAGRRPLRPGEPARPGRGDRGQPDDRQPPRRRYPYSRAASRSPRRPPRMQHACAC